MGYTAQASHSPCVFVACIPLSAIQELQELQELAGGSKSKKREEWARQRWKEESGYHRRSLVETAVFRLKTIFGDKLSSRGCEAQAHEIFLRCAALNRMTHLGMMGVRCSS